MPPRSRAGDVTRGPVGSASRLFYWAVRRFGAGLGSMVTYLVPIATLALAFLVPGERPQPLQFARGAVILAGVRLATRRSGVPVALEGTAPA